MPTKIQYGILLKNWPREGMCYIDKTNRGRCLEKNNHWTHFSIKKYHTTSPR